MFKSCLPFFTQAILFSFLLATSTSADINPYLFRWQFSDIPVESQLATCSANIINIIDFNSTIQMGVPPYYIISYAVGGTPVKSLLGSDESNLVFTVTQPPGSQLLLSVVDSLDNPGGSPNQLITVIEGQTTQCVTTPPNEPAFTVSANVSGTLQMCAPWGITISGGSPPYNITLAALGQPVVTNSTMPKTVVQNHLTYINRAILGAQLVVAVNDVTGRWASGTPSVTSTDPNSFNCNEFLSTSEDSTVIDQPDAQSKAQAASVKKKYETIIAIITVAFFLVVGVAGYALWNLRKRRQHRWEKMEAPVPTQFPSMPEQTMPDRRYIGVDAKQGADRRNIDAPVYYSENISAPLAPGVFLAAAGSSLPPPPSAFPQLLSRSQSVNLTENPPPRYESRKSVRKATAGMNTPTVSLSRARDPFIIPEEEDQTTMSEDHQTSARRRSPGSLPPRYQSLRRLV